MFQIDATNLPRIMNCPGWLFMPATLPDIDNDPTARDEGTAAHWLAQQIFNGCEVIDTKAPNGFTITAEMSDHVHEYLSALDCGAMEVDTSFGDPTGTRWRVNARADHIKFNGTALTVDDFKFGWRIVEPEMNWTLIAHAIGHCAARGLQPVTIDLRIHQPRPYHPEGKIRSWSISYNDLLQLHKRIDDALSNPSKELRTGSHCAKCHALPTCPAARIASMNAIDATEYAFSDTLPNEALSSELDTLRRAGEVVKLRLEALEELATHRIKNGESLPDYALEMRYGDTRFKTGITAQTLQILTGIDCVKPAMITPAETKRRAKAAGNNAAMTVIDSLTERPMTGTKLVRIGADKRARKLLKK